ncbi:hypothetical protein BDR04DRAFT_1096724 [Suillus decipiens]|nr:hypothetical protein BDR04DRAFT_1096724 [Suillus decipiens]
MYTLVSTANSILEIPRSKARQKVLETCRPVTRILTTPICSLSLSALTHLSLILFTIPCRTRTQPYSY